MNNFIKDLDIGYIEDDIPAYSYQLDEIMNNFNFEQVRKVMLTKCLVTYDINGKTINYHTWKMFNGKEYTIPTVSELKKLAKELLYSVIQRGDISKVVWSATGPFKAINRYGILELDFIIESWSID